MEQIEEQIKDVDDAPNEPAIRQFLADRRHLRFEDTDGNWEAIEEYLAAHDLPVTVCSLALSFEQLSESGELELTPLGRERTADEKTEGELKAEEAERTKSNPAPGSKSAEKATVQSAREMTAMFRKRQSGEFARYKNGRKIGAASG